jgi:hypothetical protein
MMIVLQYVIGEGEKLYQFVILTSCVYIFFIINYYNNNSNDKRMIMER